MPEQVFRFKQFTVNQDRCAMKIGTDGVLLGAWAAVPETGNVLDIGTGTGLIALMLAQRSKASIEAIEIDQQAAVQAAENFAASPWASRLKAQHTSLQQYTPAQRFDLIVCNPPYFESAKGIATKNRILARHSGSLELSELLQHSARLLKPTGSLALIIPAGEETRLLSIANENGLFPYRQLNVKGTPAAKAKRVLLQLGFKKQNCMVDELIVENSRLQYSDAYRQLTKDFYLAF